MPHSFTLPRLLKLVRLFAGGGLAIGFSGLSVSAQTNDGSGTLTFGAGATPLAGNFLTSSQAGGVSAVIFEPTATIDKSLTVDTDNTSVTMGSGSAIIPASATSYALRFLNAGGSLVANGATLRAFTAGTVLFQQSANATLTNTTIDFAPTSASGAAAVLLQNGGTFSATGGSIAYNPVGSLGNINYAFRNTAGSLALSLTNVTVTSGTTTDHRSYGIDLTGGGTVDLLGTTTVTSRQFEALRLNGAYTVTNAATITRRDISGNAAMGAVLLRGGATSFTNQSTGNLVGSTTAYAGAALRVDNDAGGSTITNAGTINGIANDTSTGNATAFTVVNSGTIATTNVYAVQMNGGGLLQNQSTGSITSTNSNAIVATSYDTASSFTLENAGTISGYIGAALRAGSVNVTNSAGATLTATGTTGTLVGLEATVDTGSATITNAGTIAGLQGVVVTGTGNASAAQALTLTNSGTITGAATNAVRVDSPYTATFTRDVAITNQAGGLIQGGLTTPSTYRIVDAAVYASAGGNSAIAVHNSGTIDARNQTSAIAVSVADSAAATITLHTGSATNGAIRGASTHQLATVTLAFSGTGSYDGETTGITRFQKTDAGTWTYNGERTGGRLEVSAGTLVLTNRDLGSSPSTTITNGTLRVAPTSLVSQGNYSLNTNDLNVSTGGRLEIGANARAVFGGNAGTQHIQNAGVMIVDGVASFSNNANFAAQVTTNGLFAGTGRSTGFVRIQSGSIFDAGNGNLASAGLFRTFENGSEAGGLTFGNGGLLRWTLANLSETGAGVNFDQIGLDASTSVTYESGARFVFDFSAFGEGPTAANTFWQTDRSWEFVNGGTVNGGANLLFADTGLATYSFAGVGEFSLAIDGRTLNWTAGATAIPEPSTWALIFGASALGVVMVRRRYRF